LISIGSNYYTFDLFFHGRAVDADGVNSGGREIKREKKVKKGEEIFHGSKVMLLGFEPQSSQSIKNHKGH
jgi:hypothetical protein